MDRVQAQIKIEIESSGHIYYWALTLGKCCPVCNAFLMLLITASVYAVLGTYFFWQRSPEYFRQFSVSLFTMFQVPSPHTCVLVLSVYLCVSMLTVVYACTQTRTHTHARTRC